MALGFVVYDLFYLTLVALLYGSAFSVARSVFFRLDEHLAWFVAAPIAAAFGLATAIAVAGGLTFCCPVLVPGRYKMLRGKIFFSWMFRSLIRRALFFPGIKWTIFSSNVLRFFALRALGAKVAFTSSFSTDADVLDPGLVTVEGGAMVGARCLLACHFFQGGELLLDRIFVGRGALLAGDVILLPAVRIGARALIKGRVAISLGTQIGEGAVIGASSNIDSNVQIGKGVKVGNASLIGPRTIIPDGTVLPWGTRIGDPAKSDPE